MDKTNRIDRSIFDKYIRKGYFTLEKHPDADLYIYGYSSVPRDTSTHWDRISRKMRGLILNSDGEIIARSFEKFFTFRRYLSDNKILLSEGQIANLPNLPFKVHEKLDGTLGILYWINDTPYIATQRSFSSIKAKRATEILHNKYHNVFGKLKKDRTYLFEALYPETKVLIDYENKEDLILLGIIDNLTGKHLPLDKSIGFPVARDWTNELSNLKSLDEFQDLNLKNREGFVITYANGFKVKVKFPWYKECHNVVNKMIAYEKNLDLLRSKLKKLIGLVPNRPSSEKIWERFNNGDSPHKILRDFPNQYKFFAIEEWLMKEYDSYLIKEKNSNSDAKPEKNIVFNIEEDLYKPCNENIMWKRWEELLNSYD